MMGKSELIRPHDLLSLLQSSIFMLPSKLKPLICGFLKGPQLFSPNPLSSLHIVRVEMLLLSLLNTPVSSTVAFLRYDLTKGIADYDHSRLFSRPHVFQLLITRS